MYIIGLHYDITCEIVINIVTMIFCVHEERLNL